jgi:hypothetical protein
MGKCPDHARGQDTSLGRSNIPEAIRIHLAGKGTVVQFHHPFQPERQDVPAHFALNLIPQSLQFLAHNSAAP